MDWVKKIEEWVKGPCIGCGSSPDPAQHVAMPVTRPKYVDPYLEQIAGPDEQHNADPESHCINPKCDAKFNTAMMDKDGMVTCPSCGFHQNVMGEEEPVWKPGPDGRPELNPGGRTRSGLTLDDMGAIGEKIVDRMGELPGIGAIVQTFSAQKTNPVDVIVQGQRGKFGCEIKTNHSQAQERFKIGGKDERQAKIVYCMSNGLKPALIGVRLNFYTDKAYIFFREGLSDTWIGNQKMQHVATLDFSDLNPFKSPDPQAQALAVDNAHLPDQSEEDEFDSIFGPKVSFDESDHPRDDEGKFTVKEDIHELKVVDKKGKHTHNVRRCKHCGAANYIPSSHKGRLECSTCGQDPDRDLKVAKIVLADPRAADLIAKQAGWNFAGRSRQGHRLYDNIGDDGIYHIVNVGAGNHGKSAGDLDAQFLRQRISRCMNGQCMHGPKDSPVPAVDAEAAPVLRKGQTIDGQIVLEIEGGLALVQNLETGAEDIVPAEHLLQQRAAVRTDPRGA